MVLMEIENDGSRLMIVSIPDWQAQNSVAVRWRIELCCR